MRARPASSAHSRPRLREEPWIPAFLRGDERGKWGGPASQFRSFPRKRESRAR